MFDLVKNKFEQRDEDERAPINVENEEGNRPKSAVIVLLIVLYVVPICLICYGAVHLHDCPAEKMVPISLIVMGSLCIVSRLMSSPYEIREALGADNVPKNPCLICMNLILQVVLLFWYFACCYWIFKMQPDTKPEDHGSLNYCQLEFYRNIFWGLVIGCVLFGLMIIGCCGLCCFLASKL